VKADGLDGLTADLVRFLRQQQEAGIEWYLDEGPPAAPAEPAPVIVGTADGGDLAPPPEPRAPHAPAPAPARPAAPAPAPQPAADDKLAREAVFLKERDRFVAETLEQLRSRQAAPAPATAAGLFDPAASPSASPVPEDPAAALAALAAQVAACTACKLHSTRTNTVFGVGDPRAEVVFIGEAPGRNEDEQGLPFVGRAGALLNDILKAIGFAREDVYICNILKCRPPENRDPERDEADACEPFLKRQLEILRPKVICCLGRHAAMTLLQTRASLKDMRRVAHFYAGVPVVVTFHPAALLRNPHWKRDTWDDVRKLRALHDALVAAEPR
jgi:DNA polymerase